jgi:hypothetical protein
MNQDGTNEGSSPNKKVIHAIEPIEPINLYLSVREGGLILFLVGSSEEIVGGLRFGQLTK